MKIVYKDGDNTRALKGEKLSEDSLFIKIKLKDNTIFSIAKSSIISIKH